MFFNNGRPPAAMGGADRPVRSLAKAVSWRVTGSIDTMLLSWFFTGDVQIAAAIGLTEVLTKTLLYYLHERAWNRIPLGRVRVAGQESDASADPRMPPAPLRNPVPGQPLADRAQLQV